MSQIKIHVLAIGELKSGKSTGSNPREWHRRSLQCFTGDIVGQIPYYADRSELESMQAGYYMAELYPEAGDRGSLQFRLGKLTPVTKSGAAA